MSLELKPHEIRWCAKNPGVLRTLADQHDCREAEAASIGGELQPSAEFHEKRAKALRQEAERIESTTTEPA